MLLYLHVAVEFQNEIVDIPVKELEVRENVCDDEEPQPVTLRPPQALYEPVTYPAMHIFVSTVIVCICVAEILSH